MASKRLTKEMRKVFIDAVMNDVPKPDDDECTKELQELLYSSMPEPVQQTLRLCPKWLENTCFHISSKGYRSYVYLRPKWYTYDRETLPKAAQDYIERLRGIIDERDEFEVKLKGAVEACKTIKDIKDAMPELAKYAPDDTPLPKQGLPVVANLMAEAVRRGWPGGKIVNAEIQIAEAA